MAEVTARFREEFGVVDCDRDAAAETTAGQRVLEGGEIMSLWVAGQLRHDGVWSCVKSGRRQICSCERVSDIMLILQ